MNKFYLNMYSCIVSKINYESMDQWELFFVLSSKEDLIVEDY